MKNQSRIIAAVLVGAAAGAAIALLLAPERGEALRDDIADFVSGVARGTRRKVMAAGEEIAEYGNDVYDKAKSKIKDAVKDAMDYKHVAAEAAGVIAGELKRKATDKFQEAKGEVKHNANELNNSIQNS